MPNKWALLIGIDYYSKGKSRPIEFEDLSACVRDVEALERYFRDEMGVTNITKLVSFLDRPTPAHCRPDHANIVRELQRLSCPERGAKPGDLVHIHYSGHGIRRDGKFAQAEGDDFSGTALVPMDVMTGGAYLTGYQLGVFVKKLVQRELRVSVTLDSCYSGSAFRKKSDGIRTSKKYDYDASVLKSDEEADEIAQKEDLKGMQPPTADVGGHRNADVRLSWLVYPTNCSILTACTLNQSAQEYPFPGGSHGVLTYYILQLLRRCRTTRLPSYERVADHVTQKCIAGKFQQRPVIHGESSYEFFGHRSIFHISNCHISYINGKFESDVGRASGVATGAIYEIVHPSDSWAPAADVQRLRVTSVSAYGSTMELLGHQSIPPQLQESNTHANLQRWALPIPTYIKFQIPPNNLRRRYMRDVLKAELSKTPNLFLASKDSTNTPPALTISQDRQGTFKIKDDQKRVLRGIPKISYDDDDAIQKLAYIVRHLTRYWAIERQQYESTQRRLSSSSFRLELVDVSRNPWRQDSDGVYEAIDKDEVVLKFTNNNPFFQAHVAMFSLNPTWGVEKIYPGGAQPTEETHGTQPIFVTGLTMEIPISLGDDPIEDILRAYVYVGENPPSWDELALPDLPTEAHLVQHDHLVESAGQFSKHHEERNVRPNKAYSKLAIELENQWTVLDIRVRTFRSSQ